MRFPGRGALGRRRALTTLLPSHLEPAVSEVEQACGENHLLATGLEEAVSRLERQVYPLVETRLSKPSVERSGAPADTG